MLLPILCAAFIETTACAQTTTAVDESFNKLVKAITATKGISPAEQSRRFAEWMNANDWRSLSLTPEIRLLRGLDKDSPAQGNVESTISVRWTGFLTSPADATYRLAQLRNYADEQGVAYYADGILKVWLADKLVLDSTPAADEPNVAHAGDLPRFYSQPIALTAGKTLPLKVEFSFDRQRLPAPYAELFNNPSSQNLQAVLVWKTVESADQPAQSVAGSLWRNMQLIPETAYIPPPDFATKQPHGLKAEYFSDAGFKQSAFTRLDPGVGLVSTGAPFFPVHREERDTVLAHCWERVRDPAFLGSLTPDDRVFQWRGQQAFSTILARVPAWRRLEFINQLIERPDLFTRLPPVPFLAVFLKVARLPGDSRLKLLDAWGAGCTLPRRWGGTVGTQLAMHGSRKFIAFRLIGGYLTGPYTADLKTLVTGHLENPDHSCRTVLACVAAAAAIDADASHSPPLQGGVGGVASPAQPVPSLTERRESAIRWLRGFFDNRLADDTLTGDPRATWLIARADVEEFFGDEPIRPQFGLPWLDEAARAAQSDAVRFQVAIERADRLLTIQQFAEARLILDEAAGKFSSTEEQRLVAEWRKDAAELEKVSKIWPDEYLQKQTGAAAKAYVANLKVRLERARTRGDTANVQRYEQMIQQASPKP